MSSKTNFIKSTTGKFVLTYLFLASIGLILLDTVLPVIIINEFCLFLTNASGFIIHLFDPQVLVQADVLRLPKSGFALRVTDECSGLQFTFLLVAGMLAFPTLWKYKIFGSIVGIIIIQSMNIIRLISLLYLGKFYPEHFDLVHENLWPVFLNIDLVLIFIGWLWWIHNQTEIKHTPIQT